MTDINDPDFQSIDPNEVRAFSQGQFQGFMAATVKNLDTNVKAYHDETQRQWSEIGKASLRQVECRKEMDSKIQKMKIFNAITLGIMGFFIWLIKSGKGIFGQ